MRIIPSRSIAVLALLLAVFSGCGPSADADNAPAAPDSSGPQRAGAQPSNPMPTAVVELETRSQSVQVAGRLRPRTRITHEVPVAGVVQSVSVEPGDSVTTGDVLFAVERDEVGQTFRPVAVRSRLAGLVSQVFVEAEEQVRQGDAGVLVVGQDGFVLEAQISDKDASHVSPGQAVSARTRDGASLTGTLSERAQEPDYDTGLFSLTFRFPGDTPADIGTFVIIDLPTEEVRGTFVPRDAVDRRYGRYYLWVIDEEDNVIRRQQVELGQVIGDSVAIADGLEVGQRYLLRLTGRERDGAPAPSTRNES